MTDPTEPTNSTEAEAGMGHPAHGDRSKHTTDDLTTKYRKRRLATDKKLAAAKKSFATAHDGLERLIENTSNAYAATPDEIADFFRGARKALDDLEALSRRHDEGRGRGWRW